MKAPNMLIIGILAVFIGISLYIYQASHLKAGLVALSPYLRLELIVAHLRRIGEHGSSEFDEGQSDRWRAPL